MRPLTLEEYIGQSHLLTANKPAAAGDQKQPDLFDDFVKPPGLANDAGRRGAPVGGDLRYQGEPQAIGRAGRNRDAGRRTILFVDEMHRFNKGQQEAFLPHIEEGTITFIGATTENPSFELNSAMLSRAKVYILKCLTTDDISLVLDQAMQNSSAATAARISCRNRKHAACWRRG